MLVYDSWRSIRMLENLSSQLLEISSKLPTTTEIIVVYNNDEVNGSEIESITNEKLTACKSIINLKIIPVSGLHYYQQKNFAAKHSHGDVIIFLDCDVIPDDGWLEGLAKSFLQPEISVVGGNSYMVPDDIYKKAFSLFWFFPPTNKKGPIFEKGRFFANNIAFRRKIFLKNQFPFHDEYRGLCVSLAENLLKQNIKIYRQPASRVAHSVPRGIKNISVRAICQGHDFVTDRRRAHSEQKIHQHKTKKRYRRSINEIIKRIRKRSKFLHLSPKDKIGVFSIMAYYYTLMSIGMLISTINPKFIRNHLTI